MWSPVTFLSHLKCNVNMYLQCDCQWQLNCIWQMFLQCACIVQRSVHAGYMARFDMYSRCTSKRVINLRCTQDVPTCAQCRHIAGTSVNYNSTVIGNHIAGTCWHYISNVTEILLVITSQANVEVTFEMWMKCIWSEHWKNFATKPEMFPTCKHPFP